MGGKARLVIFVVGLGLGLAAGCGDDDDDDAGPHDDSDAGECVCLTPDAGETVVSPDTR